METNNGKKTNLIIIAVLIALVIGVFMWWKNSQAPAGTETQPTTSTGVLPTDNTQEFRTHFRISMWGVLIRSFSQQIAI